MSHILAAGAARMKLEAENYEARIAALEAQLAELATENERLKQINANLMGDDEDAPRYTTKRLKQEIAKATEDLASTGAVKEAGAKLAKAVFGVDLVAHPRDTNTVDAHETANVSDKPEGQQEPVARWEAIDEQGNDNFATSIYEADYKGLLVARCNQNGNHPWQAAAIIRGLEQNKSLTRPSEQAVTEAMERFERIADIIERNLWRQDEKVEDAKQIASEGAAALKAAMEAGG